jgi:3-oxoacyl-[acyl-carrier-protein] synthase II
MSHDAYHVTSIEPRHDQITASFTDALDNASVSAADVRYLNAHGPGTTQCDAAEATVLERLFGPETGVYSVKPLTGHCQGAASAIEVAVTAMAYDRGMIPAPPVVAQGHPRLLDGPTPLRDGVTIKSSLGTGGHNSVVVLAPPA